MFTFAKNRQNFQKTTVNITDWDLIHSDSVKKHLKSRMLANALRDGRPAEYRWRPLFNAAKFG